MQSTLHLKFLHLRVIYEVYAFSTHGNHLFFHKGQFLVIATISKKSPNFATRLCYHGNPGNHGNTLKNFSIPLACPNILTF